MNYWNQWIKNQQKGIINNRINGYRINKNESLKNESIKMNY